MNNEVPKGFIKPEISNIGIISRTDDAMVYCIVDIERDTGKPYALIGLYNRLSGVRDLFSWDGKHPVPTNTLHELINFRYDWPFGTFEYDDRIWFRIHFINLTDDPISSTLYSAAWGDNAKENVIDNLDQLRDEWFTYMKKLANTMELCISINKISSCEEMLYMTKTIIQNIMSHINNQMVGNLTYHNIDAHANSSNKQKEVISEILSRLPEPDEIDIMERKTE